MSNRTALRKLSKQFPAPPEVDALFEGLIDEAERSVVIVSTSIVEAALERRMMRQMRVGRPSLMSQLFENRGPASDFNGKIVIAEAFGIITQPMAAEMHSLRAMRNVFGHARVPVSFETPEIKAEMKTLKMLNAIIGASGLADDDTSHWWTKSGFLTVARILTIIMESEEPHEGHPNAMDYLLRVGAGGKSRA